MIDTRAEVEEWKNTKEYLDRYPTMHEYAEGKRINPKLTDLISRADAIEHLKNVKVSYPHADISLPIDLAIKAIEILPSADAVQGEWIWRTDIPIGDGRTSAGYICSHCGKDYWHGNVFNYCPNCGARMKGGAK